MTGPYLDNLKSITILNETLLSEHVQILLVFVFLQPGSVLRDVDARLLRVPFQFLQGVFSRLLSRLNAFSFRLQGVFLQQPFSRLQFLPSVSVQLRELFSQFLQGVFVLHVPLAFVFLLRDA